MHSVFTYGSLLHTDEWGGTFESEVEVRPARLLNYKRHFGQRPTFRDGGVLTVHPSAGNYCNGLLIEGLSEQDFDEYEERESGYDLRPVDDTHIVADGVVPDEVCVPVGERETDKFDPDPEYKALCFEGAKQRGERFAAEFVRTTFQTRHSNELAYDRMTDHS